MLAMLLAAALSTQQPAPATTEVSPVDVAAPPKLTEREAIKAFVGDIADLTGNERLARWDKSVCPGVVGMPATHAQFVNDRVATLAVQVGLKVQEPGCKANIMIVLTDDGDAFAQEMVKAYPETMSKWDLTMTPGRKALNRFMTSDAPVRWWHITRRVAWDGTPYGAGGGMNVWWSGRISSNTRDDFDRALVIVDAKRVGTVRFEALADYLAFVALAQVDPEASPDSAPSILTLFADRQAGREPLRGMTDWDRAYVAGLYETKRNALKANTQKWRMYDSMEKRVDLPPEAPPPPKPVD